VIRESAGTTATVTAQNINLVTDFSLVASALERRMIEAGWTPISQAFLASAPARQQYRLRTLEQAGVHTLLEKALALGDVTQAEVVLLVRSVRLEYGAPVGELGRPGCATVRYHPLEGTMDATLVRVSDGEVLWTGRSSLRAT